MQTPTTATRPTVAQQGNEFAALTPTQQATALRLLRSIVQGRGGQLTPDAAFVASPGGSNDLRE